MCVFACVRACVCVCVSACVRACVCACVLRTVIHIQFEECCLADLVCTVFVSLMLK